MKNLFILSLVALFLGGCGSQKESEKLDDKNTSQSSNKEAKDKPPGTQTETSQEANKEKPDGISLESWVAQLPPNDPRRLRYQAQINNLWDARNNTVESNIEEDLEEINNLKNELAEAQDPQDVAELHRRIGSKYVAAKDYEAAAESYNTALQTYEELEDSDQLGDTYLSLGSVYVQWRNHGKAHEYFTQAADIKEESLGAEHPNVVKARNLAKVSKSINDKVQRILAERAEKEKEQTPN